MKFLLPLLFLIPTMVNAQSLPSYAQPSYSVPQETIGGTISSLNGSYVLYLNDARGFVDMVYLQTGTVILPTGTMLQPGMPVTISGYAKGNAFIALQIVSSVYEGPPTAITYPYPYAYRAYVPIRIWFGHGWRVWDGHHYR